MTRPLMQLARLEELHRLGRTDGLVAVLAVEQLETRAIRVHAVQAHLIVIRGVVPASEDHLSVGEH